MTNSTLAVVWVAAAAILSVGCPRAEPPPIQPAVAVEQLAGREGTDKPPLGKEEAKRNLRAQGQATADAAVAEDWNKLADYTHPKAVALFGGQDAFLRALAKDVAEMKTSGFTLAAGECGNPSEIFEVPGRWYAILPSPIMMKRANGARFLQASSMLGVSEDGGRNWLFVNSGGTTSKEKMLKHLFPDLPAGLDIPRGQFPLAIDE